MNKIKTYKFVVIASLFYTISAYEMFHKNTLLSDSEGNLYLLCPSYAWQNFKADSFHLGTLGIRMWVL